MSKLAVEQLLNRAKEHLKAGNVLILQERLKGLRETLRN